MKCIVCGAFIPYSGKGRPRATCPGECARQRENTRNRIGRYTVVRKTKPCFCTRCGHAHRVPLSEAPMVEVRREPATNRRRRIRL